MAEPLPDGSPTPPPSLSSTIRRRLIRILVVEFVALMGVAAAEGAWPGAGIDHGTALTFLIACAVVVPSVMAWLAGPLMRDIRRLDAERAQLLDLYGQARQDSVLDSLTGLGNHRSFQEEMRRQLEHAKRHSTQVALVLVDVDDLAKINDLRGHAVGDRLLAAVGHIANGSIRRGDRGFRTGGDEFALLLPGADVETGLAVARRLLAAALSMKYAEGATGISVSIGVSAFPAPTTQTDLLYRHAGAALYWSKRHGRTTAVAFDPGLHLLGSDERPVEDQSAALAQILSERALRPVFQPIFSLSTGEAIGYEGLIRPTDGAPISDAGSLFAAAMRADRTVELDMMCLEIVAKGVTGLEPGAYLSVNLSPRTLESDQFQPREVTAIFERQGILPSQLVIEVTEREEILALDQMRRNAAACRKAGMRLAADDVGSGNAGLRLLSEIHFDVVKIDLSLVQGGILHDPSHAVIRALQELAARWKATIVAEGVETAEQLAVIRELGITAAQGYLLARPATERRAEPLDLDALMPIAWAKIGSPAA